MDRFVVRETRTRSVYSSTGPPPKQVPQFQEASDSSNTMYLNNVYANERSGLYDNSNMNLQCYNNNRMPNLGSANGFNTAMGPGPNSVHTVNAMDQTFLPYPSNAAYRTGGEDVTIQNTVPSMIGSEYQNRNYIAPDRSTYINTATGRSHNLGNAVTEINKTHSTTQMPMAFNKTNTISVSSKQKKNMESIQRPTEPAQINKKIAEVETQKVDAQFESNVVEVVSKAKKLKALQKTGPRAFSGPIEKVLKWHKSLQDIGIFVYYEIVAKCIGIRSGDGCAKHLVVRDDNGPAMLVVYYEIDFLLPYLTLPCTIRVIGRIMYGTCRLHAFRVRLATGDDVAILPRRAAAADHHVSELCKEYGNV